MSFTVHLKTSLALMLALGGTFAMAKSTSGKVVGKLGEATLQKAAKPGEWTDISVGNKVREKDQIRTQNESQVSITLQDGSSITEQENSLVEFTTLEAENGVQTALTDVKTGKVKFDAQKQHGNSSFKFKTATATAAIRGTDGMFGKSLKDVSTYLSLVRGNAIMTNENGDECEINGGQTAFIKKGKPCKVIDAKSSGNEKFIEAIDSLLDNEAISDEQLLEAVKSVDSTVQEDMKKVLSSINCEFDKLPDTVTVNRVTITGKCNGSSKVSIAGSVIDNNGKPFNGEALEFVAEWSSRAEGAKKFNASCFEEIETKCESSKKNKKGKKAQQPENCKKKLTVDCGTITTFYLAPPDSTKDSTAVDTTKTDTVLAKPFAVTTTSPAKICEPGSITIEGTFDQTDPDGTLFVKLGKYTSRNLVPLSANGEFSHTITISDIAGNWNEKKATVEYKGKSGTRKASIDLEIDKTCRQVNQGRPTITFNSSDSIRCEARYSLTGATYDMVHLSREIDGTTAKETAYNQNTNFSVKLTAGVHDYAIKAEDQAGNKTVVTKKLGCYPQNTPRIEFAGKIWEVLTPPPPPPQTAATGIHKTMRFKIAGVTQQDPIHIKHIKVTQENTTLLDISNGQINDLDYDVQVELARGTISQIKVFVEMKNGRKLTSVKTYEVK